MSNLDSVSEILNQFYRLVGTRSGDPELRRRGEAVDDVAYQYLTQGCRSAQLFMLDADYPGWRKRSSALTFSGSDDADGGTYVDLPTDFLRAYGSTKPYRSALVEADGKRWGTQIDHDQDHRRGNFYYFRTEQLWLARDAQPPTTIYLDYHYMHPEWEAGVTVDFPIRARRLIPTHAAVVAMDDNWLPGGQEMEAKIDRARRRAELDARKIARPSKEPRRFSKPTRLGNHW